MTTPFAHLPQAHYGVIYADPPWAFRTYSGKTCTPHRTEVDHYKTMSLSDIQALPVADLAAKDCALFLWVVDSHLDEAMDLIRSWGFRYKTKAFTWVKTTKPKFNAAGDLIEPERPRMGMGYWTRKSSEVWLMATRGRPKRLDKGLREVLLQPRREHSRKPDEFRDRIEALVAGPARVLFFVHFTAK